MLAKVKSSQKDSQSKVSSAQSSGEKIQEETKTLWGKNRFETSLQFVMSHHE